MQRVDIWRLIDMGLGIGVLAVALGRLGAHISIGQALTFAATLLAGGVIAYSFWMILATSAFWFVRVENILMIFQSMYEAGRWPVSIYPGWLRVTLTFIVPVAFAVTVPAEALAGKLTWRTLAGAWAFAAGLFILAHLFWRAGHKTILGRIGVAQGRPSGCRPATR